MYIMCRLGGGGGHSFLIKYKLKKIRLNPPPPKTSEHRLPFFRHQRPSPSLPEVIPGHRLAGEPGGKNSDHSTFSADSRRLTGATQCGEHLLDKVIAVNGTTDLDETHRLSQHTADWQTRRTRRHRPAIDGVVWKTTTSALAALFFFGRGERGNWGRQTNRWQDEETHTLLGNRKSCFFFC